MDCPNGSRMVGLPLPKDPMVEILSRVPAESLRELKLVSRDWRDLITDPFHRKRLPQTLEGFFHGGSGDENYGHFTSLFRKSVPEVDPSFSFLTKLPGIERMTLLDSCNGLLLFGYARDSDNFGYVVCNPATKEFAFVPNPDGAPRPSHVEERCMSDGIRFAYTFLMFDPAISPHFHLVQVWQGNWIAECVRMDVEGVHCYSSEVRGWSDRSSEWKRGGEGGEWEQWGEALIQHKIGRAFVNGMLHFVVYHLHQQEALIVALDVKGKTCWITRWEEKHKHSGVTFIGQSQGRLHCISMDKELRSYLSVWVLEDYDTEEWILKHRVNCSKLFGKMNCSFFYFSVVAIHPDHNVVFFVQHWNNQKLLSYNMDSRELHGLCSDYESTSSTSYVPYFMESAALANK